LAIPKALAGIPLARAFHLQRGEIKSKRNINLENEYEMSRINTF